MFLRVLAKKRVWIWLGAAAAVFLICLAIFITQFGSQVNVRPFISPAAPVEALALPTGFEATVFADGLDGPRFMAVGPDGDLYVAERGAGRIIALPDRDRDGAADGVRVLAAELPRPHSLVYHDEAWYIGVPTGIIRLVDRDADGAAEEQEILIEDYPTGGHNTRTVAFLPDGRMVVSVGSSCNVCLEDDPRRAAIVIYEDGPAGGERIYARGLRNAVGLALQPETGSLWATNNGRDMMGDDLPPETVYQVEDGGDYGWPGCHSGRIADPEFGQAGSCTGVIPPVVEMQAHSAPLGLTFYDGTAFPEAYRGDLFIAFHGSWNRSIPTGYKVVRLDFTEGESAGAVVDFAAGWLDPETGAASGRPVGVTVGSDGALYVSDDKGGIIYRIAYTGG